MMSRAAACLLLASALVACNHAADHAIDAPPKAPADGRVDGASTDGSSLDAQADASMPDAAASVDAAPMARIDYWPCNRIAQITGAKSEYYVYTLVPVAPDFAMGADKHGLATNMEIDAGDCQLNPGAYTCSNFVVPNIAVGGYQTVNGQVLAICGSNYSPSQFGNKAVVWGSLSASTTSYFGTVTPVTCSQTGTLSFTSVNDSHTFTIKYELYSVPSGERAIIGHEGVTDIDQFDNFAENINGHSAGCIAPVTCSGMPTGTVTSDVLGNTYYDNQLLVVCEATYNDVTTSQTFTQGSAMARVVHWAEQ